MAALPGTTGRRRIYLMRHGHVDYFSPEAVRSRGRDVVLTPLGRVQAEAAGHALAPVRFDRALCSGLNRTRETAEIVLALNGDAGHLTLEHEADLAEIHGGAFEPAQSRTELAARLAFAFDAAGTPDARMGEGGERFEDALARSRAAIERLLAEPAWHTILIVAHEGINRLLLGWVCGGGLGAVAAFEQDLACINVIDVDLVPRADGQPGSEVQRKMIKSVNLTPYNWTKHGMTLTSLETIFQPYRAEPAG